MLYSIRCKVKHSGMVELAGITESNYVVIVDQTSHAGALSLAKEAISAKFPLYNKYAFTFAAGIQSFEGNLTTEKVKILLSGVS